METKLQKLIDSLREAHADASAALNEVHFAIHGVGNSRSPDDYAMHRYLTRVVSDLERERELLQLIRRGVRSE